MEERLAQFQTGGFEGGTNVTSVAPLVLTDDRFKPLLELHQRYWKVEGRLAKFQHEVLTPEKCDECYG